MDTYTFLAAVDRAEDVTAVQQALSAANIPYRQGLLAGGSPRVIFTVPRLRLREARSVLAGNDTFEDDIELRPPEAPARFPKQQFTIAVSVMVLHLAIVIGMILKGPEAGVVFRRLGLLAGGTLEQPWRLVTSLFLHSGLQHAFWNGASMIVFAVPLLTDLGTLRTVSIYLVAGIGGGIAAVSTSTPGTIIIGSSGAVAGLFGAWVVIQLLEARVSDLGWRARVRTMGIAMLVLPSLVTPMSSTGRPISVSSHLGGLATGMIIGALISSGILTRWLRFVDR